MQKIAAVTAFAALFAAPLQAATDPGLMVHDTYNGGRQIGMGARAAVTIPLGRDRSRAHRTVLSFDAGPAVTRAGSAVRVRDRFRVASLTRLAVRPGYDAEWSFAGHPFYQVASQAALTDQHQRPGNGDRRNVSTLGGIGIGVGVLVVAAGVGFIILLREAEENSD